MAPGTLVRTVHPATALTQSFSVCIQTPPHFFAHSMVRSLHCSFMIYICDLTSCITCAFICFCKYTRAHRTPLSSILVYVCGEAAVSGLMGVEGYRAHLFMAYPPTPNFTRLHLHSHAPLYHSVTPSFPQSFSPTRLSQFCARRFDWVRASVFTTPQYYSKAHHRIRSWFANHNNNLTLCGTAKVKT